MRSSREIRREAWGILKGRWFWRLLCVAALLQLISAVVNRALIEVYGELSITTVGDYLMASLNAMRQGLSYSLPTAKAYYWMVGGFLFQLFISYIFAAIFVFGFMGLLLKASRNDGSRWFAESFGGFARPLEITWLLLLVNLLMMLPIIVFGIVPRAVVFLLSPLGPLGVAIGRSVNIAAILVGVAFSLAVMYGYRQAWFIKNERVDLSAVECLRTSRRMMRGFKWRAFCLDLSFVGWFALAMVLLVSAAISAQVADNGGGTASRMISFAIGLLAFWTAVRVVLGMAVSRVVFYRELQGANQ